MAKQSVDKNYKAFNQRLKRQFDLLKHDGTQYRRKTAELALSIAESESDLQVFLKPELTRKIVQSFVNNLDEERLQDVTKMLVFNAKAVKNIEQRQPKVQAAVNRKMKERQPVRLTKVKK